MNIPPVKEKCVRCGKCVEVIATSSPHDINAPRTEFDDCNKGARDCPIKAKYAPRQDLVTTIWFVPCGSE
jgi:hypothetical protein